MKQTMILGGLHYQDLIFEIAEILRDYRWSLRRLEAKLLDVNDHHWQITIEYDLDEYERLQRLRRGVEKLFRDKTDIEDEWDSFEKDQLAEEIQGGFEQ